MSGHPDRKALLEYVACDGTDAEHDALEEHLFDCDACARVATELAQVGAAVRAAIAGGKAAIIASDALLATLERNGVPMRHYHAKPGGRLECTVSAGDVFVVAHYAADFTGVTEVTIVATRDDGVVIRRMENVPVVPGAQTLHVLLRGDWLRAMPTATQTVTLSADDRVIARYVFSHTAFVPT